MEVKQISDEISVSPQIKPDDLKAIQEAGFKSIICNRPDDEEAGQINFPEIENAARAIGLDARYIPFLPGKMTEDDVSQFAIAMRELPGPVFAYCKSGGRSAAIWNASQTLG